MSSSKQSLVDSLAADIKKALGTSLQSDPNKLDAVSEFTPSRLPKFSAFGEDFAKKVIAHHGSKEQTAAKHPLTREEVTSKVIEWFSGEVSQKISSDLIEYAITGVTKVRLSSSRVEETIDGSVSLYEPLSTRTVTKFEIEFDGAPVMWLALTVDVDAEFTINDAVTKLESEPVRRIEEIDLRDCAVGVAVSSLLGITIAEFAVPIKGAFTL